MNLEEPVQAVLVPRTGTHLETIAAVARASIAVALHGGALTHWPDWERVGMPKTVRRVKAAAHLDQARAQAEADGVGWAAVPVRDGEVIAFAPIPQAEFGHRVRIAQVAELDLEREPAAPAAPDAVEVAVLESLSTGKAAAQAAHALWAWLQTQNPPRAWVGRVWRCGCVSSTPRPSRAWRRTPRTLRSGTRGAPRWNRAR